MADTSTHTYALALGSNRPLSARRTPARLLDEAAALIGQQMRVIALAPTIATPPMGPSSRLYANSALLVESPLPPPALLALLQSIEHRLGRRRHRRKPSSVSLVLHRTSLLIHLPDTMRPHTRQALSPPRSSLRTPRMGRFEFR